MAFTYLLSVSYIILGYSISYLLCKLLKPEVFLIIFLKNKKYSIRIHHLYFLILSLIGAIINIPQLLFTSLGIGLHDLIIEIKKKLNNVLISKNS